MSEYKVATLSELVDSLTKYLNKYPELGDRKVSIAAESGYSGAEISSPVTLFGFNSSNNIVHILTTDDIDLDNNYNVVEYTLNDNGGVEE